MHHINVQHQSFFLVLDVVAIMLHNTNFRNYSKKFAILKLAILKLAKNR